MSNKASSLGWENDCRFDAFTLLELLVVVATIGVLAALLLPAVSWAKQSAKAATCRSHLHQLGLALKMYVDDNSSKFPFYLGPKGPAYGDAIGWDKRAVGLVYWSSKLIPYYPMNWSNTAYHCPGYKGVNWGPYERDNAERLGSYAYNGFGCRLTSNLGLGSILFWSNATPVSESQIKVPSEMFAVGDSKFKMGNERPGGSDFGKPFEDTFDPVRHGNSYNELCCDGRVIAMSPWLLFSAENSARLWNMDHQPHPELWPK